MQIKLWVGKPSYKHVHFIVNQGLIRRKWRYIANWKCNCNFSSEKKLPTHYMLITPFLRFVKQNGMVELGLGNYYFWIGFSPKY